MKWKQLTGKVRKSAKKIFKLKSGHKKLLKKWF